MKLTVPYTRFITLFIALFVLFSLTATTSFAQFDFGKSYINVTKGTSGGTVEPGDVLEIRASIVVRKNGASNTLIDNVTYTDAVPAGTTYIPGTVAVLTNEGKIFKSFTDAVADDQGWISGTTVRINLGFTAGDAPGTPLAGGRIRNTHIPSFFGSTCIMIASFRVTVTSAIGAQINTGGGSIGYKVGVSSLTFNFPSNPVAIYTNYGICSNTVGVNSLGTESNGTFGSGNTKDRAASANVPAGYTYAPFSSTAGMPNDYYYGVSNNTSGGTTVATGFSVLNTYAKPDNSLSPSHRIFSVWDIIGDHTGAVSPTAGNPPTGSGATGGYMLVVNAAYKIDSAFQHTIINLCPNTYYELSFWVRNICSKCGCDVNGVGASSGNSAYIPTVAGPVGSADSSGVYPNLTFDVNGVDYYTTGNVKYTGQWVKKGFTYLTGPAENSITLKIMNNAPGGGGNDWALDDITVATCSPNFTFTPTASPTICNANVVNIGAIISSFFPNYTNYKWQKSTNNGVTWTDVSSAAVGTPVWNGSAYVYTVNYPPFLAYRADSGTKYKVIVSTTLANLGNVNCQVSDGSTTITLNVIDCGGTLNTNLLSFSASLQKETANLSWTTTTEFEALRFYIEKSTDGVNFTDIATVNSYGNHDASLNTYFYTDPDVIKDISYYRIRMTAINNQAAYSRVIQLSPAFKTLSIISAINPFANQLDFYVNAPKPIQVVEADIVDMFGRSVAKMKSTLVAGSNHLVFSNTQPLPAGAYTLRLRANEQVLTKSVIKLKN